jgi:hypothetical protein
MAEHRLSAVPTHSRWDAALSPRLTIDSGDVVRSPANALSTQPDHASVLRRALHFGRSFWMFCGPWSKVA